MPYLVAALVIVGVLCVINLLLTVATIRRLREHTELLSRKAKAAASVGVAAPGSSVGPFTVATVEGRVVTTDDLAPGTLVGFLAPGCRGCLEELPAFLDLARAHHDGARGVLAVVSGDEASSVEYVARLSPFARVVVAPPGHEIESAFAVGSFPAFFLVGSGGVVRASGPLQAVAAA